MAQVKVWNDNVYPYSEEFKDQKIMIPAKSFIMMEAGEALLFKGSFAPIQVDADGQPIPQGYKMIRIEETPEMKEELTKSKAEHVCLVCKYQASSSSDLSEHIKASHQDQLVRDEEAEREIEKRRFKKGA